MCARSSARPAIIWSSNMPLSLCRRRKQSDRCSTRPSEVADCYAYLRRIKISRSGLFILTKPDSLSPKKKREHHHAWRQRQHDPKKDCLNRSHRRPHAFDSANLRLERQACVVGLPHVNHNAWTPGLLPFSGGRSGRSFQLVSARSVQGARSRACGHTPALTLDAGVHALIKPF